MPAKEIAVQGCTLTITGCSAPGTATITSSPSTKCKAGGNGIYKQQLNIQIIGCSNGTCIQGSPVSDSIMPTAIKVKCENGEVLRVNDKKNGIVINGTDSSTSLACSFPVNVEITSAGQTKVKAQ
jgi:hypothetical protein